MFSCWYMNTVTDIGKKSVIAFNTPNTTKWVHMIAEGSATASAHFKIYETTSIDVGEGTQLTIYNHNRNSTKTAPLYMQTVPTSWTDAMILTQTEVDAGLVSGSVIIANPSA